MAKDPPKPVKVKRSPLERLVDRVTGATLCFGDPVQQGEQTVIPVARVRLSGGFGYGGDADGDGGGGGGGHLDAQPLGFISVGAEGARYVEIPDPEQTHRMVRAGAAAVATIATALAGANRARGGGRRPARLLRR